ncbi:hypothetical protein [Demequina lutea]|uniref:Uncharacterized protein n=1 Tax=Demequina lutea TaxID=431489 RepID=A0A7Y9Z9E6_9MICO|nr:hypothetical protein [Demequina lutea]NYI41209.1 hypothetical protein [Demequina lutea]
MPTTARWSTHPRRYVSATTGPIPPAHSADAPRPTAITAECGLVHTSSTSTDCQTFSVREFLILEDGKRVILREGLEFTIGSPRADIREGLCADALITAIRNVVLPEVSAADPERPWDCLVQLSRRRRVQTCADELAQLPYEVKLTDEVLRWL